MTDLLLKRDSQILFCYTWWKIARETLFVSVRMQRLNRRIFSVKEI